MALTFTDAPVAEIVDRCRQRRWQYHDYTTVVWKDGRVFEETTPVHDVSSGPLFFNGTGAALRLRYPSGSLMGRAIPVEDLVSALGRKPLRCSVAGVATVEKQGGIFVEYVPGRILHLAGALFFWRVNNERVPLARLDWRHFAQGDEITIRVKEGAILAPDYLQLEDWRRSSRACFGQQRVLLPVVEFDAATCALHLGAGAFRLTLPCTKPTTGQSVWLQPDNQLEERIVGQQTFNKGDCCLLGIDSDSRNVIVLGDPEFRASPYEAPAAFGRVWEREVFHPRSPFEPPRTNWIRLQEIISAVGGALPATVEGVSPDERRLYFSFRLQDSGLTPGHLGLGTILGFLSGLYAYGAQQSDRLLLWVGGGVALCDFDNVISGVPGPFRESVATTLAEMRCWIWLKADEEGSVSFGLRPDALREMAVTPMVIVEREGNKHWGMVVRSDAGQNLYWILDTDTAWTPITATDARRQFCDVLDGGARRSFTASKILAGESKSLSLLECRKATRESDNLCAGYELNVVLRQSVKSGDSDAEHSQWLVESTETDLLLRLETASTENHYKANEIIRAEMATVRRGRRGARQWRVTAVPAGTRIHRLALPSRFTQRGQESSEPSWETQCEWLADAAGAPWDESRLASSVDEPLERRLVHAAALSRTAAGSAVAWLVAEKMLSVLRSRKEASLISALLALEIVVGRILAGVETQEEAKRVLLETVDLLGRRAVRSLHIEPLEEALRSGNLNSSAEGRAIWKRIEDILRRPIGSSQMARMKELLRYAMMTGDSTVRSLSSSIYVASGNVPRGGVQSDHPTAVLIRLVGWRRGFECFSNDSHRAVFPPRAAIEWLQGDLRKVLVLVKTRGLGIDLLPALPRMSIETSTY